MAGGAEGPVRRAALWLFRNRETGAITVAQWPNLALWLFLGLTAARLALPSDGSLAQPLALAATGCLSWWALAEIVSGANPWRRLLGGLVLAGIAIALARRLAGLA
ncbi:MULTISPECIES: hypothetical protein [Methylobacterium]|uniref:Uncharacterized protein n=1 Tax=Methylobacterium jeotgali TaxID=381630 RepID=A0ABQ4SVL3_9HYPH|nr:MULTISPECIES: hypothetical protein [Methylobacterium]GBU18429.1 hypothetical protein AwMethylo_26440 [Methylobacterium sp.]GJE05844.1 hypothetical protein AOPFMNJM_1150 [Methylobacterium jeotgali]